MSAVDDFVKALKKATKKTGSDYTGTVTRVDGKTAYVQLTGSDISDTPCGISVDCKPGDSVRVRVSGGRAWVYGNDTLPPSNDKKEVALKMSRTMENRAKDILIDFGSITFLGNTLVVKSKNFNLDRSGNAVFSGRLEAAGGTFDGTMKFINSKRGTADQVEIGPDSGAPIIIQSEDPLLGPAEASIGSRYIEISAENPGTGKEFVFINGSSISASQPDAGTRTDLQSSLLMIVEGARSCYVDVNGVHTSSDSELKTDIKDVDPNIAMRLHPVSFRFHDDPADVKRYGFIAQEVADVMPDAVEKGDAYLNLNYQELIAPAIALLQDQEKRIAELEAKIKEAR